jgi:hypothetical protein
MSLRLFLTGLWTSGQATVGAYAPLNTSELDEARSTLAELEASARLELPGQPPPFDPAAAVWAAVRLYRAAQLAVFRDLGEEVVKSELSGPCPYPLTPAVHYAVDLTHRYLPGLLALAKRAARNDPLVDRLHEWGRSWPLSSIGIPNLGPVDIAGFAEDPCLLRVYADRILAAGDAERLADPRAAEAVRAAVGIHSELAGKLAPLLARPAEPAAEGECLA